MPSTERSPRPSGNGSAPTKGQLPRRCGGVLFQVMSDVRLKDWTTIKGRMEPEGTKKQGRHKNEGRVEGGTHLRVAGMQCNIRKTYTQPPSNPALMKN